MTARFLPQYAGPPPALDAPARPEPPDEWAIPWQGIAIAAVAVIGVLVLGAAAIYLAKDLFGDDIGILPFEEPDSLTGL